MLEGVTHIAGIPQDEIIARHDSEEGRDVTLQEEMLRKCVIMFSAYNYRCFSIDNPLIIKLSQGYIAFVEPNNSGKSAILKCFYDIPSKSYNRIDIETLINVQRQLEFPANDN